MRTGIVPSNPANLADARPAMITLNSVSVDLYGSRILEDISFSIGEGEIVAVVGPSGCGKTTLLRTLAGLVAPTSGEIEIGGQRVVAPRRDLAVVFQDYAKALLPWRNARDNVALALEARGVPRAKRDEIILPLLDLVGLKDHTTKFPREMSGGMQQRLQIARALAQEPRVLFMDEPFGALDAMTRRSLQDEMLGIAQRTGKTIFFVTHDLEEALYISDRVIGLLPRPGRVAMVVDVNLPRPRNQISTPEHPNFLMLRRELFDFITSSERK